jgi:hypothetical protein
LLALEELLDDRVASRQEAAGVVAHVEHDADGALALQVAQGHLQLLADVLAEADQLDVADVAGHHRPVDRRHGDLLAHDGQLLRLLEAGAEHLQHTGVSGRPFSFLMISSVVWPAGLPAVDLEDLVAAAQAGR